MFRPTDMTILLFTLNLAYDRYKTMVQLASRWNINSLVGGDWWMIVLISLAMQRLEKIIENETGE